LRFISSLNTEKPFLNASSLALTREEAFSKNSLLKNTLLKNSVLKNIEPCKPSRI